MHKNLLAKNTDWQDYELLDTGGGERLERFGTFVLARPFPEIDWEKSQPQSLWDSADAIFIRTKGDAGYWKLKSTLPDSWHMYWQDAVVNVYTSPFKHTGVFPEQSTHWDWMKKILLAQKIRKPEHQPQVLNLFAYTGMASVVCTQAGAKVTHVDSSRAAIGWAKKNQAASGLDDRSIRWILDDAMKFVSREVNRGVTYDAIIMDPPVYGHGAKGEIWDFKRSFTKLLDLCSTLLVADPLFVLINAYAVAITPEHLETKLKEMLKHKTGLYESGELLLEEKDAQKTLSTGLYARFSHSE